jgi:hypothetical protein
VPYGVVSPQLKQPLSITRCDFLSLRNLDRKIIIMIILSSHNLGKRTLLTTLSIVLIGSCFSGCSLVENLLGAGPEVTEQKTSSSRPNEGGIPPVQVEKRLGLQVTWQVPSEPEELTTEKRITVDSLLREDDPEFGPVYRYTVSDIAPQSALFVSIAAYKGDRLSEFSEVMRDSSRR